MSDKIFFGENKGQGMLEMVFAVGFLLMVISAILALAWSNIFGQKSSEMQVVANNLAREGIEVVRSRRDSNFLAGINWREGIISGYNTVDFNSAANQWSIVQHGFDFNFADPPEYSRLFIGADGVFNHQAGADSGYHRVILVLDVCRDQNGQESVKENCVLEEINSGLKLVASVGYRERGRDQLVNLEDLIYDWK